MRLKIIIMTAISALLLCACGKEESYIMVGDQSISEPVFNYYFQTNYETAIDTFGTEIGSDTDLDSEYEDGVTWRQYLEKGAVSDIQSTYALLKDAKEQGFEYDTDDDVEDMMSYIEDSVDDIEETYGCSESRLKEIVSDYYYAYAYYESLSETEVTDDDIREAYKKAPERYESVDYLSGNFEKKEDAQKVVEAGSEKEFLKICDSLVTDVDLKMSDVKNEGTLYSSDDGLSEWLFSADRKEGDTVVYKEYDGTYSAVYFIKRYLDDTKSVNIRMIPFAMDWDGELTDEKEEAAKEEIDKESKKCLNQWKLNGGTEKAFSKLAKEYEQEDGGLVENIINDSGEETDLTSWIFDEKRETGDYALIDTGDVIYFLYYCGEGKEAWLVAGEDIYTTNLVKDHMDELLEENAVSDPNGNLHYEL